MNIKDIKKDENFYFCNDDNTDRDASFYSFMIAIK